jgi:UDP-glucose 4-epimerase
MKIGVIGGVGFIGNEVVRQLLSQERQVFIIDNKNRVAPDIADLKEVKLYEVDIRNFDGLDQVIASEQPDVLIHLAAIHFIPECNQDPANTIAVNVEGTVNVLRMAERYKVAHTVIASSGAVYGDYPEHLTEFGSPIAPVDIYGWTKKHVEDITSLYAQNNPSLNFTLFRLFNTYGPRETNAHILPEIIHQLKSSNTLSLGNIKPRRDMIFTEDVARAIIALADRKKGESIEVVNLCSGIHASVEEMIALIAELTGREIQVLEEPARYRKADKLVQVGSNAKLLDLIGYKPSTDLREGVRKLLVYESLL